MVDHYVVLYTICSMLTIASCDPMSNYQELPFERDKTIYVYENVILNMIVKRQVYTITQHYLQMP